MSDKKIYFENLDALRFLCFLSVFFYHSFHTEYASILDNDAYQFITGRVFANGNLGVNFFFVLSGFLITYLLIEERKTTSTINLKNFWIRRILRIWPLFYACVGFGFIIFPILKEFFGQTPNESASLLNYLTFTNNFDVIQKGFPDSSVLGVLWSVAIEEQFYLFWPLILFALPVKHYWIPFIIIICGSMVFRSLYNEPNYLELHTLSCIGDMSIGALGAWLVHSDRFKKKITGLPKSLIICNYLLFIVIFLFRKELLLSSPLTIPFERILIAIIILIIILEQTYANRSFFKLGRLVWMTKLGRITYGLYCLHFVGILITLNLTRMAGLNQKAWQVIILETTIALGLSILIASVSYRFFEKPFLKLKERFAIVKSR